MEHIAVDGIDYVFIGSLGGKPDKPATFFSAGSQYLTYDHFGFARLESDAESFRAAFIDVQGRELYSWERLR